MDANVILPTPKRARPLHHIPLSDMEDGCVYFIKARNAILGLWSRKENSFVISREKFGSSYLAKEYHWDEGPPFGTSRPFLKTDIVISDDNMSLLLLKDLTAKHRDAWRRAFISAIGLD
jgi:hypothetical protein